MSTFFTEYKNWPCYTSFWSLKLTDHFGTNGHIKTFSLVTWGQNKNFENFADDVMGTEFDQKYFLCIF